MGYVCVPRTLYPPHLALSLCPLPPPLRPLLTPLRSLFIFFSFSGYPSLLVFFPCPEIKKISEGEIDEYLINETQNAKIEI